MSDREIIVDRCNDIVIMVQGFKESYEELSEKYMALKMELKRANTAIKEYEKKYETIKKAINNA